MANVTIADLALVTLPIDPAIAVVELQTTQAGEPFSGKITVNDLLTGGSVNTVQGTSTDNPAVGGGTFDGVLLYVNFTSLPTARIGFNPAGDDFIITNLVEGGEISLRVRDGTEHLLTQDYGITIPTTGAIRVPVGTTAQEPAALNGQIRYDSDTNRFRGVISGVWVNLDTAVALNDLTDVTLTAPATGSVLFKTAGDWVNTPALSIDPVGAITLDHNTQQVFTTSAVGVVIGPIAASNTTFDLSATAGQDAVFRAFNDIGGIRLDLLDTTGQGRIAQATSVGVFEESWITFDRNAAVTLFRDGAPAFATAANGATIFDSVNNADIVLNYNDGAVDVAFLFHDSATDNFFIQNAVDGANVVIQATDAGSVLRTLLTLDPDAEFTLNRGGASPTSFSSISANVVEWTGTRINATRTDDITVSVAVRNSIGGIRMIVAPTSGLGQITQTDSAGVNEDTWITFARNARVGLSFNDVEVARTAVAQATQEGGAFEAFDGDQFNPVMSVQTIAATGNVSRSSTTVLAVDPDLTVALVQGIYMVELYLFFQAANATPDVGLGLAWSGAVNDQRGYIAMGRSPGGAAEVLNGQFTAAPSDLPFSVISSATESTLIRISGLFQANGSGTLALHWAQNVSDAGATTRRQDSRMFLTRLSD